MYKLLLEYSILKMGYSQNGSKFLVAKKNIEISSSVGWSEQNQTNTDWLSLKVNFQ